VGQTLNDARSAFARRLLELGIPLLEVLITNRPNKIADFVENPVRVLRVTAPNSRFDEPYVPSHNVGDVDLSVGI
jgi:hypothetical protein